MNDNLARKTCLRPLLLASAVGMACQNVMAQSVSELSATPFATRPLHLQSDTSISEVQGVNPNVMFFVDDSGSMQALVGKKTYWDKEFVDYYPNLSRAKCIYETKPKNIPYDCARYIDRKGNYGYVSYRYKDNPYNDPEMHRAGGRLITEGEFWMRQIIGQNYANPFPCDFSSSDLGTSNGCYYTNWPLTGFFRFKQQESRIKVTIDALTEVVNKNKDKWNWNIYTLWGSETRADRKGNTRRNDQSLYSWWPTRHKFMKADQMKNLVKALSPTGGTPTTERYVQVARIMKDSIEYRCQNSYIIVVSDGDANQLGIPSTATRIAENEYSWESNFEPWEEKLYGVFSDRINIDGWRDKKDKDGKEIADENKYENWIRSIKEEKIRYYPYRPGAENGISLFSHILLNTDLKGKADSVPGGKYGAGRDKEGGYWDEDRTHSDRRYHNTRHGQQNIQTFTIGFGEGLSSTGKGYLEDAATCKEPKENKCFFTPTTGSELAEALDIINRTIEAENTPGTGATFSASTPAVTGSTIADLAATLTLDTGIWSSQLLFAKFHEGKLTKDTQAAKYKNRKVLVNNGVDAPYWLNPGTPASRKADFGIANDDEFTRGFVPWLIRHPSVNDTAIEKQVEASVAKENRTVSVYRSRDAEANGPARQMADVVGTPVVAMGRVSADDKKQKYVITAANDGMVYIFAHDPKGGYDLTLNYLPAGMQRESWLPPNDPASVTVGKTIRVTAEANYGKNDLTNPHVYLNNGSLSWVRTPKTGGRNQQDILLGTMGQGGRGVYALAIAGKKRASGADTAAGLDTSYENWPAEIPLWETDKSKDNMLGYTISTGVVGQVATQWKSDGATAGNPGTPDVNEGVHLYAFVANGYKSDNADVPYDDSPTLYVYDMMGQEFGRKINKDSRSVANGNTPGKLIKKIPVGGAEGALATPTLVDANLDGLVDFAYAGDQHGDLYRFDLRGAPGQWKVAKLYDGRSSQPITAAPAVYKVDNKGEKYVVVFGTGSDIYDADRKDREQQVIMGIHDDLTKDPELVTHDDTDAIVHQEMKEQINPLYATNKNLPEKIRVFSKVNPFEAKHRAWSIKLAKAQGEGENITTSERVVTKPQVLTRTAFITTRIYDFKKTQGTLPEGVNPEQTCFSKISQTQTGGNSWQMAIDVLTGGGPLAGSNPSTAKGAYFEFSDIKVNDGAGSDSGGGSGNSSGADRVVAAGFSYGALASAPALVDSNSASSETFQTSAQGELGYHGEIVGPFGSDPDDSDDGEVKERNPLQDLKKDCIPNRSRLSLLVATGGENTGSGHNNVQTGLVGPPCFEAEGLIRIDWRQIPL
ncbi:MAG: PilC/PilY family type IV pilus protein [Cardiobacteriaceae bacterium]|nr:PilC/PilY family type IV pilus protein [Cardiobacteriaceae bacterium]